MTIKIDDQRVEQELAELELLERREGEYAARTEAVQRLLPVAALALPLSRQPRDL